MSFHNQLTTELIDIDNTQCSVNAAFNISDDRFVEMMRTLQEKAGNSIKGECKSEYMTRALYSCNPKSILEVFVIGQAIGSAMN